MGFITHPRYVQGQQETFGMTWNGKRDSVCFSRCLLHSTLRFLAGMLVVEFGGYYRNQSPHYLVDGLEGLVAGVGRREIGIQAVTTAG